MSTHRQDIWSVCAEGCEARWGNTAKIRQTDGGKGRRERNKKKKVGGVGAGRGDFVSFAEHQHPHAVRIPRLHWSSEVIRVYGVYIAH